jgi:nitroimidazol reductase NimA-like FMN-containing flavoprotein (pyridoxamine 5'-phosphate oxidase superfamily)
MPIYFVYHQHCLYSFSTAGQKIEWMRVNPLVWVQADQDRQSGTVAKRRRPRPL